jgi:cysteine synthase A
LQDQEGPLDYLVAAVSATGIIHGVARRLRVIAVDAVGSVIFGAPAGAREIPGIGSSRDVVYVNEWEAAPGCHDLVAQESIFVGGSSGSVIAAIKKLRPAFPPGSRVLSMPSV